MSYRASKMQDHRNHLIDVVKTKEAVKASRSELDRSVRRLINTFVQAGFTPEQQAERIKRLVIAAGEQLEAMIGPDDAFPILARLSKDAGYRITKPTAKQAADEEFKRLFGND